MKLLIVDDQDSVVRGLVQGIDWAALGFDSVDTAYNAIAARASLLRQEPEVMLCDVEMPVENGLELLAWMRSRGMETRCIFLSAHTKFSYAQQAIKNGGFDYIVQPAPYEQVESVVKKAVEDVQSARAAQELQKQGQIFDKNRKGIAAALLRDYLTDVARSEEMSTFEELGLMPRRTQDAWLVLFQPLYWQDGRKPLEWSLLSTAVSNMCTEIFEPLNMLSLGCVQPRSESLTLVLQSRKQQEPSVKEMTSHLMYLQSACEHYLHFTSAMYFKGPQPFNTAPQLWPLLEASRRANVTLTSGVFAAEQEEKTPSPTGRPFYSRQMAGWPQLLRDGYAQAVEQEALQLLDEMDAAGHLNGETLRCFYQDYLQVVFNALREGQKQTHDLFDDAEGVELYRNGMKTVDSMKALLRYVTQKLGTPGTNEERSAVEQVCSYIAQHLESELRREELAQVVHLSPDYLTRIFKQETNQTLKEYVIAQKMQEARSLLRTTSLPVSLIAAKVGYSNFSHFSTSYRKVYGRSPQEERQANV